MGDAELIDQIHNPYQRHMALQDSLPLLASSPHVPAVLTPEAATFHVLDTHQTRRTSRNQRTREEAPTGCCAPIMR